MERWSALEKVLESVLGSASALEPTTGPDSELTTAVEMAPLSVVQMALDLEESLGWKSAAVLAKAMVSMSAIEMGARSAPASDPSSDQPSALA